MDQPQHRVLEKANKIDKRRNLHNASDDTKSLYDKQ